MSYHLNLGQWNSIFAVPASLVDRHLKLCSENQLKVILYILRHPDDNTAQQIASALSVSIEEVSNAVEFWTERGLIAGDGGELSPAAETESSSADVPITTEIKTPKKTAPSRATRPDSFYVSKLLSEDKSLSGLIEEAQTALGKPLSSGDTATMVMLYDTFGLPCDVIAMLIHYAVSVGKSNMRAIERIGINWSDNGIYTVHDAEREIERLSACNEAWSHVSVLFGIRNIGHPTRAQLDYATRWVLEWGFSDEMLNEAYERCVNSKGEYNIRYINGILQKWNQKNIRSLDDLRREEQIANKPKSKQKKSAYSFQNDSYDSSLLDEQTLFDD